MTIKDSQFKLVAEVLRSDDKKRVALGRAADEPGQTYNVYRNRLGQIVLDPVKTIPAYEAWLFKNRKALVSVQRGLTDSAARRVKDLGSFAAHADKKAK